MPIRYRVDFDALKAEERNEGEGSNGNVTTTSTKLPDRHTSIVLYKKIKEHPNTRPQDIISAEMSQAAYIDHIKTLI